jgi:hypothetical protein
VERVFVGSESIVMFVAFLVDDICYRLTETQGLVRQEGLGKLKKIHSRGLRHELSSPAPTL